MKRHTFVIVLLACGFLAAAGTPTSAQQIPPDPVALPLPPPADGPAPTDWTAGNVDFLLLGREDVASSKFEEYRLVPKGMADHAERLRRSVGVDIDVMPSDMYGLTFGYARRHDDYPNRPFKVAGNAATESGLLEASYDMYSVDFNFTPGARGELSAFYTYEKMAETNQWVTLTSGAVNNLLTYAPWDKGHTFGTNTVIHLVPDKWALTLYAQHQKIDGFLDITAREAGTFYTPGRTTLIPAGQGGAADIRDYDDMRQTTAVVDLGCTLAKAWTFRVGYAYDKFTTVDEFSDGTTIFPQAVLFYLNQNDGNYSTNMAYTRLTYHF